MESSVISKIASFAIIGSLMVRPHSASASASFGFCHEEVEQEVARILSSDTLQSQLLRRDSRLRCFGDRCPLNTTIIQQGKVDE